MEQPRCIFHILFCSAGCLPTLSLFLILSFFRVLSSGKANRPLPPLSSFSSSTVEQRTLLASASGFNILSTLFFSRQRFPPVPPQLTSLHLQYFPLSGFFFSHPLSHSTVPTSFEFSLRPSLSLRHSRPCEKGVGFLFTLLQYNLRPSRGRG